MSILERGMITLGTSEKLNGSYTSFEVGRVIIEVDRIVNGHRPERFVFFFWPMEGLMYHLSSGLVHGNLDAVFSRAILPFGSNSAELDSLVAFNKSLLESF
jgi:hypothetical protein